MLTALLGGLIALLASRHYNDRGTSVVSSSEGLGGVRYFSKEDLSPFTGEDGTPIYLAIVGHVFDVTKGKDFYGVGAGYSGFAGKDGTRAYVSGNFTKEGLVEEIDDMTDQNIFDIWDWLSFYNKEEKYVFLGYVEGIYFDKQGNKLPYFDALQARVDNLALKKLHEKDLTSGHPTCNSRWESGKGSKVWCEDGRVPRKWYVDPTKDTSQCRCFAGSNALPAEGRIELYKDCAAESSTCEFPPK
jgi:predicted heme/steroid binding protein